MGNLLVRAAVVLVWSLGFSAPVAGQAGMLYEEPVLLNEHEVGAFHRIFRTTEAQRGAVAELLAAGMAKIRAGEAEAGRLFEEYRKRPEHERTKQARQEVIEKSAAAQVDVDALRTVLLEDLAALLTTEQMERWRLFEYFRTRERVLYGQSSFVKDRTNLLALIEAVGVKPADHGGLAELLIVFERELDAILVDLEKAEAAIREAWQQQRDASKAEAAYWPIARRLAQHNFQHVRRVCAMIPPEECAELRGLYDRVSLEEAYGPNGADISLRAAPELPGLEEGVREAVRKIVREYAPKYDALTERIAAMEKGVRMRDPSEEGVDQAEWDPVRMERGRVLAEAQRAVQSLLTPAQMEETFVIARRAKREWREKMTR